MVTPQKTQPAIRMGLRFAWALATVVACGESTARADRFPTLAKYIANSEAIVLVRAPIPDQTNADLPPGKQLLLVEKVLAGVYAPQSLIVAAGSVALGEQAVMLMQYEPPAHFDAALQTSRRARGETIFLKVVPGNTLESLGIPTETSLSQLSLRLAELVPEQIDLQRRLVAIQFQPQLRKKIEQQDPRGMRYARFLAAVLDVDRNPNWLAALVESADSTVALAADAKLRTITRATGNDGAGIAPLMDDATSAAKRRQAAAWAEWSQKNLAKCRWNESLGSFVPRNGDNSSPREWPTVPARGTPTEAFDPKLLQALDREDPEAFAAAFRVWIDSGVIRDRLIKASDDLSTELRSQVVTTPDAPRLLPETIFNKQISAIGRMKVIALFAQIWHFDRFAAERAEAIEFLAKRAGEEDVRRAAFWEMRNCNVVTPGQEAARRLACLDDEASQKLLLRIFVADAHDDLLDAVRLAIKSDKPIFTKSLLGYVKSHRDDSAQWAGRILCQEKVTEVVPLMLEWLKDPKPQVRGMGAFNLCWQPVAESVPALIAAIKVERDATARCYMLEALAQNSDPQAFRTLVEAVENPDNAHAFSNIARGLARIKDKKALPALAKLAHFGKAQSHSEIYGEAVNAFGYVSGLFPGHSPSSFWTGGVGTAGLDEKMAKIEAWEAALESSK